MVSLPWHTWQRLLIWFGIGLVLYFAYGYRHSRIGRAA
jgi:APA family basic amino acid/polyamine antiporter